MKRLVYSRDLVKYLPKDFLEKIVKDAIIHALNPVKVPHAYLEVFPGSGIPVFDSSFNQKNLCIFGVPQELAIPMDKKGRGKGRDRKEKYKLIYDHLKDWSISDSLIQYACDVTRDSAPILAQARMDATVHTRRANYKGSPFYMYLQGQQIIETAKELAEIYKYCYFLTTTFDANLFDGDREIAFKEFNKEQQKFIKAAKRKYGVEIIKVIEVTNRGYPHAHMLIFSNEPLGRFAQKKKKSQIIKQGHFYNFTKRKCTLGRIQLKTVENDGVHKYISKYVAKANFDAEAKGKSKKGGMSLTARKAKMSAVFPSVFGYRAFSCTWSKKEKPYEGFVRKAGKIVAKATSEIINNQVNNSNACNSSFKNTPEGSYKSSTPELVGDSLEALLDIFSKAKRSLASSISFSIKENKGCAGMLRRLAVMPGKTLNKKVFGTKTLDDFINLVDGNAHQVCVSCCGCPFIQKILEFANHPEEEWAEMLPSPLVNLADAQNEEVQCIEDEEFYTPKYILWGELERRIMGTKVLDSDLEQKYLLLREQYDATKDRQALPLIWDKMCALKKEQMERNFIRDAWVYAGYTVEAFKENYVG